MNAYFRKKEDYAAAFGRLAIGGSAERSMFIYLRQCEKILAGNN